MNHQLLNIVLIYIISGLASAFISVYVLKIKFLGQFWGALTLALLGAFIGGLMGSVIPVLFNRVLHLFVPSIVLSFTVLYFYRWLSVLQDY
ncbi:MAG: hypothetical protein EH225_03930 [Calditrichaeota bacterium]|nr:MAG: hypothetical protein EH225_03930 [Calditrichota bacterium]